MKPFDDDWWELHDAVARELAEQWNIKVSALSDRIGYVAERSMCEWIDLGGEA